MNKLDKTYTDLLQDILDNGYTKSDRTGTGTISVFGRQIRHNMKDGFPLLTTKKMPFKTIVTELLWFLNTLLITIIIFGMVIAILIMVKKW